MTADRNAVDAARLELEQLRASCHESAAALRREEGAHLETRRQALFWVLP